MPTDANTSRIGFLSRPSGEGLLRTAFWALLFITVGSITYAFADEMFSFSDFPYKHRVFTVDYRVLEAITSTATVMLAVVTAAVWRLAPRLRKFGIAACLLELYYLALPVY